eukprot:CAMPEP_0113730206 /NCGR_PEP_ID=MMETSP0038_2-20120614/43028_1 /TAXON_ID=2898 /ORGANISM="Cryptomonas paramecium" /LENGTH=166 /DNA_ID=CAMNT_0000662237 /DNA_START=189 /DNA_END=684 /DNA_ORIENTATION=- /assembly_acc=CAM_ASM_000170
MRQGQACHGAAAFAVQGRIGQAQRAARVLLGHLKLAQVRPCAACAVLGRSGLVQVVQALACVACARVVHSPQAQIHAAPIMVIIGATCGAVGLVLLLVALYFGRHRIRACLKAGQVDPRSGTCFAEARRDLENNERQVAEENVRPETEEKARPEAEEKARREKPEA